MVILIIVPFQDHEDSDGSSSTDGSDEIEEQNVKESDKDQVGIKVRTLSDSSNSSSQHLTTASDISDESDTESDYNTALSEEEDSKTDGLSKKFEKLKCNPADLKIDFEDDLTVDDILKPIKHDASKENEGVHASENQEVEEEEEKSEDEHENEEDYGEDNDEGWITPS